MPKDDDYYVIHTKVALGSGELILGQGYDAAGAVAAIVRGPGGPATEKDALLMLVPLWVSKGVEVSAVVHLCLMACATDDPELRVVGLNAIGTLAARGEALAEFKTVEDLVRAAMEDSDPTVKAAAAEAWHHIR